LQDVPKGGGYYLFRTHSLNSIKNLWFALQQMEGFTFGNMAGIPVNLVLESQRNKKNMEIFVVRIEWDFDPKAMRLKAIEEVRSVAHLKGEIAAAEASARKLLTTDDPDEDIVDEYYPETRDATPAAPKPSSNPAETKLAEMLNPGQPETTAERINRERAEEKQAQKTAPESPAPTPAPAQAAQDAPGAPKKRGRKPKAQQPPVAAPEPAPPAQQPSPPSSEPAAPPEEQADLIEQEPVPDPTTKPEAGELDARFF
jgi:hypothetical protein